MESLWPKFEKNEIEKNNAITILRTQARAIKTETNGVINATFSKISYQISAISALSKIQNAFSGLSSQVEEVLEGELSNKENINGLYEKTKYKFEIYNSEYRFRLFIVNYSEMYPITIEVDEGISEDIQYKNGSPISNDKELEDVLQEVFCSNKVYSVVMKMLQKEDGK